MEIRNPSIGKTGSPQGLSLGKKKDATGSGFDAVSTSDMVKIKSAAVFQNAAVFSVDPLFMNTDESSQRRKAIKKGFSLLDALENLRHKLVSGNVTYETLLTIKNHIQELSTGDVEPGLKELILEIETRALVELAKIKMGEK
jgi:hypothetical protein